MKLTHYIYLLGTAAAILTACNDDDLSQRYTVGEADNVIVLGAGIGEGESGVQTRAGSEDSHHTTPGHKTFSAFTQLRLRMDGTWLGKSDGKAPHGTISSSTVSQITTASIGDGIKVGSETENTHNKVAFSPSEQLYWDDYGMADPANMPSVEGNGRDKGLTIYGVAVDGVTTAPAIDGTTGKTWMGLQWNVGEVNTGVINQTGGWAAKDLLTSNNVQAENTDVSYATDGTYKFEDRASGKLLEFTHAMTKITVNLTAGEGFPGYETGAANAKFQSAPTVTLLNFNYTGTVDVVNKTSTPPATTTVANILAWRDNGTTWTAGGQHTSQLTALVFPGNKFTNETNILKLEVDGNTLYVNATKINAANTATDDVFEQGKNYIFNILYNKTGIVVTATVTNWIDVNSEEDKPEINIDCVYGHEPGTVFDQGFTLYRSTTITGSYIGDGDKANVSYVAASVDPVVPAHYTMAPQLYWPTHSTHYFFRGVWPVVDSKDITNAQLGPTADQVKANTVDVENVAYHQGYYPSDLMIARPLNATETATDEACKVHSGTQGICATTGDIRMNFRYMMSQVKVELTSSDPSDKDYIAFDANTKVEIIGGYKDGVIRLSDCTSDFSGKTVANYQLNNTADGDYDSYHDAIIPQTLTDGMKFRITVTNFDNSTDTYETVIKNIKVKEGSADPALITAWASGKAYTYTLKITKTAIKVTATLTDWVPVTANDDVWF